MYHYTPSTLANTRIDIADILRGIAIGGIVIIHFIEHLNFYAFPEPTSEFWANLNQIVWDSTFFLLAGKMYAIFATLFGLSFFIQHDNQAQKGIDFRPRFAWRMLLLCMLGIFDLLFYNGDILLLYAVCGLLIIPLIRASDKVILSIAIFLGLQPIELTYIILGLINPETPVLDLGTNAYWGALYEAQANGSIVDVAIAGLRYGLPINFMWAIEYGRMTQTVFLFLVGILIGRKRLFYNEGNNLVRWKNIFVTASIAMVILTPAFYLAQGRFEIPCISRSVDTALNMWKNFAMMTFIVSGTVLLYYKTNAKKWLIKIAPYGRMSLTNYLTQSIIGAMLFYNWGFGLYNVCGHTASWLMGAGMVLLQYLFCRWWLNNHKRGPFEELWRRGTWIR